MKRRNRSRRKKKSGKFLLLAAPVMGVVAVCAVIYAAGIFRKDVLWTSPEELLTQYMSYIPERKYEQMYEMLNIEASRSISVVNKINPVPVFP